MTGIVAEIAIIVWIKGTIMDDEPVKSSPFGLVFMVTETQFGSIRGHPAAPVAWSKIIW